MTDFKETKDEVINSITTSLHNLYMNDPRTKNEIDKFFNANPDRYNYDVCTCIKENLISVLQQLHDKQIIEL